MSPEEFFLLFYIFLFGFIALVVILAGVGAFWVFIVPKSAKAITSAKIWKKALAQVLSDARNYVFMPCTVNPNGYIESAARKARDRFLFYLPRLTNITPTTGQADQAKTEREVEEVSRTITMVDRVDGIPIFQAHTSKVIATNGESLATLGSNPTLKGSTAKPESTFTIAYDTPKGETIKRKVQILLLINPALLKLHFSKFWNQSSKRSAERVWYNLGFEEGRSSKDSKIMVVMGVVLIVAGLVIIGLGLFAGK